MNEPTGRPARSRRVRRRVLPIVLTLASFGAVAEAGQQPSPAAAADGPLRITLEQAIERGERANLAALVASAAVDEARGTRRQALARLFPQIDLSVRESRAKINLASFGLPAPEGETSLVGPFNVFEARVSLSASLFDARARAGAAAAAKRLESADLSLAASRDEVAAAVASLYVDAVSARSRIATAAARLDTARAFAQDARDRHEAGRAAGIDVLRAEVALAAAEQRSIEAEQQAARLELAFARAIGIAPGSRLELEPLAYAALPLPAVAEALERATRERADLMAAASGVQALEATERALRRGRLPRLELRAGWAPSGPTADTTEITYDASVLLEVPLFEGGRIGGEVAEAGARTEAARARLSDLEVGVEVEVRTALLDAEAASRRVEVARKGLDLARQELGQARDRFAAGVASSLEVTAAQDSLALADGQEIGALADYNRAKVELARSLGIAHSSAARYLRGDR